MQVVEFDLSEIDKVVEKNFTVLQLEMTKKISYEPSWRWVFYFSSQ